MITEGAATVGVVLWIADRRGETPRPKEPTAGAGNTVRGASAGNGLAMLRDVALEVSVELGRTDMTLAEVLALHIGSVVELDRPAGSPVDVRVNGTLLARGEVVVIDGEYAVRISEVIDPEAMH
jgi:flagellar motor switch protein FliN/FliY